MCKCRLLLSSIPGGPPGNGSTWSLSLMFPAGMAEMEYVLCFCVSPSALVVSCIPSQSRHSLGGFDCICAFPWVSEWKVQGINSIADIDSTLLFHPSSVFDGKLLLTLFTCSSRLIKRLGAKREGEILTCSLICIWNILYWDVVQMGRELCWNPKARRFLDGCLPKNSRV